MVSEYIYEWHKYHKRNRIYSELWQSAKKICKGSFHCEPVSLSCNVVSIFNSFIFEQIRLCSLTFALESQLFPNLLISSRNNRQTTKSYICWVKVGNSRLGWVIRYQLLAKYSQTVRPFTSVFFFSSLIQRLPVRCKSISTWREADIIFSQKEAPASVIVAFIYIYIYKSFTRFQRFISPKKRDDQVNHWLLYRSLRGSFAHFFL